VYKSENAQKCSRGNICTALSFCCGLSNCAYSSVLCPRLRAQNQASSLRQIPWPVVGLSNSSKSRARFYIGDSEKSSSGFVTFIYSSTHTTSPLCLKSITHIFLFIPTNSTRNSTKCESANTYISPLKLISNFIAGLVKCLDYGQSMATIWGSMLSPFPSIVLLVAE
jgi:hypothetical protein